VGRHDETSLEEIYVNRSPLLVEKTDVATVVKKNTIIQGFTENANMDVAGRACVN
jgi:hypothetical protein